MMGLDSMQTCVLLAKFLIFGSLHLFMNASELQMSQTIGILLANDNTGHNLVSSSLSSCGN